MTKTSGKNGLERFRQEIRSAGSLAGAMREWLDRLRHAAADDPAMWISRFPDEALMEEAKRLDQRGPEGLPLFGMPFAVKDNIDVVGLPTTAACPAFAYQPGTDAPVVARMRAAGAICLGKTNLDQFATGLVGTRSPYGVPRNAVRPDWIPGGSSSGSAVAVARGLAAFSLGTDTAGSGRVPAALNRIVGWKPTRGRISTRGVVPACRSLDCVSVFTRSAEELAELAGCLSQYDEADPWVRRPEVPMAAGGVARRLAIPLTEEMEFFGDHVQQVAWEASVQRVRDQGFEVKEVSCRCFFEAARLLYEGPWVAERYRVVRALLQKQPEAIHPVTRSIIEPGAKPAAWEAFAAMDQLAALRRESEAVWDQVEALLLPTIGTAYTVQEVLADPLRLNSRLGHYTNFMNLLDLAGVALPGVDRTDGGPFGLTLVAPAWHDERLWATGVALEQGGKLTGTTAVSHASRVELAVFGAHMRGMPLNGQLLSLGGEWVRDARTAPRYRMVVLPNGRPGVFRVNAGGRALTLELWRLPTAAVGALLEQIPAPLALGKVELEDGREVTGFLVKATAVESARDITDCGGWRAYLLASGRG